MSQLGAKCCKTQVLWTFWLTNVLRATAAFNFSTSDLQKVARTRQFLKIFTCKCASRHSGVPFLNIGTSKSSPTPSVFLAFLFANVLRATAACHFWTSELRKWLRHRQFFSIFTCKCASRHSRVPFLFQNGSVNEVFCAFWLANVLFATAACHFSPVCGTAASASPL